MPTLRRGSEVITVSGQAELRQALEAGFTPVRDTVTLTDPTGRPQTVRSSELGLFLGLDQGGTQSATAGAEQDISDRLQAEFGGTAEQFRTLGERALGTASFGLTDIAGLTGGEDAGRRRRANPSAALAGTAIGAIGPALATGGSSVAARALAATPAGLATRAATGIAARGAGGALGSRVAASAAGFATEGALFGAGDFLSQVALEDADLSAEALLASAGRGALFGAAAGGAFPIAGAALRAGGGALARRLRVADDVTQVADDVVPVADDFALPGPETAARNEARLAELGERFPALNEPIGQTAPPAPLTAPTVAGKRAVDDSLAGRALPGTPAQQESTTVGKLWPKSRNSREAIEKGFADLEERGARMQDAAVELERAAEVAKRQADELSSARIAQIQEQIRRDNELWFGNIIPRMRAERGKPPFWKKAGIARGGGLAPAGGGGDVRKLGRVGQLPRLPTFNEFNTLVDAPVQVATPLMRGRNPIEVATAIDEGMAELAKEVGSHVDLKKFAPRAADTLIDPVEAAVAKQADEVGTHGAGLIDDAATNPLTQGRLATAALAPSAARAPGGVARGLLDIAAGVEAAQTLGLPLPDVDQIPVVGPLAGAYLKFRALRALWRGGKEAVKSTTATRAAERAAETRNRIADGLERLIARKPGKGKRAAIPTARAILARPVLEGSKSRGGSLVSDFEKRSEEIRRGVENPSMVRERVAGGVPPGLGTLGAALGEAASRRLDYLKEHLPVDPREPNPFNPPWRPTAASLASFARRLRAANDPLSLIDDLNSGQVSMEAVDAVKTVWPRLFLEMQKQAIELVAAARVPTFNRRVMLSLVFEVVGDPSMTAARLVTSQAPFATPPPPPQAPPTAAGLDVSSAELSPFQRRSLR